MAGGKLRAGAGYGFQRTIHPAAGLKAAVKEAFVQVDALKAILAGVMADGWRAEAITGGQSGGRLFRVHPAEGSPVVVKLIRAEDVPEHLSADYPTVAESEYRFYTELMPQLGVPGPELLSSGRLPDGTYYLVMEDLSLHHFIPPEAHIWCDRELRSVVRTYGLLHGRSLRLLQATPAPGWLHADPRVAYDPEQVLACIQVFAANSWTAAAASPIVAAPGLADLVRRVSDALSAEPSVVLYNDFYPTNVAIPRDDGLAKLFDWQLVGTGPMQVDLVNIGLLGREPAFARVDQAALLDLYLDTFAAEAGRRRPGTAEFRTACRYAGLLAWAVFLPRMVKAMERCNAAGRQFSPWMAGTFSNCMADFDAALSER